MAFLGNRPAENYISYDVQHFTTSATTSYTLDHAVANENELRLVINNVVQQPGSSYAYSASGTSLTLTSATSASDTMYCVYLGKAVQTVNPPSGSVGTAQLASEAVTNAKVASSIITGQTAETSIATDDLILLSDTSASGALKKMTRANFVSGVGQTMTPAFQSYATAQTGITDATPTKVDFDNELFDTDSCYDTSNKRFLPTTAGKYYIYSFCTFDAQGLDKFHSCYLSIYRNGSYYKQSYFDEYDNYLSYAKSPFVAAAIDFNGSSDYVEIYATFNVTTGTNHRLTGGAYSSFGGYKIIGA